jgi:WD40 repeat protein
MSHQPPPATPFKGLTSYAEEDAPYFFGREEVVNSVIARVQAWRHTLLYGASGVGKSSVLHAGVAYQLREDARRKIAAGEHPEYCVVVFNEWPDDPVQGLLRAVRRAVDQTFPGKTLPPASASLSGTLVAWSREIDCDLLIILDQFEEYFTYHSQEDGPGKLLYELPQAVRNKELRASFLISLREDALAKLDRFQARIPDLLSQFIRLRPLAHDEARLAIEKPIEQYNRVARAKAPVSIDPYLVEAILGDAQQGGSPGEAVRGPLSVATRKRHIEAPYLQQIMVRLWQEEAATGRLRLTTYDRLGRAKEIVRTHLSNTIGALSRDEQEIAARIFRHLVTPSGTKIAQSAEDIADYAKLELEDVTRVLEKLSGMDLRILRAVAPPPDQPGVTRYEIFHDVLAAPITTWWKDYEAEEQRRQDEEEAAHKKEIEQARTLRRRLVGALALAAVLAGVTIFAVERGVSAKMSEESAKQSEVRALSALDAAEVAKKEAIRNREAAETARQEAVKEARAADEAKAEAEEQRQVAEQSLVDVRQAKAEVEKQKEVAVDAQATAERLRKEALLQRDLAQGMFRLANKQKEAAEAARDEAQQAQADLQAAVRDREAALSLANLSLREAVAAKEKAESESKRADAEERERARIDREGAVYAELTLRKHRDVVNTAAFSRDMQTVVTAGKDGRVLIWNTSDPLFKRGRDLFGSSNPAEASPGPTSTPTSTPAPTTAPAPTSAPTSAPTLTPDHVIAAVSHDSDSSFVATAKGNEALVWDRKTNALLHRLVGHKEAINSVTFFRGERKNFVLTGSNDDTAMVWDLSRCGRTDQPCGPVHTIEGHKDDVLGAEFHPKTPHVVVTASRDETARIKFWGGVNDCPVGVECKNAVFDDHEGPVNSASFNGEGELVVTASDDGTAMVWRSKNGNRIRTLREYSGVVVSRAKGIFGFIRIRRVEKELRPVKSAAFHPNTSKEVWYVATAGEDQSVLVWDVKTGTIVRTMSGHLSGVSSVTFSPKGKYIITAGKDRTARIWNPCKDIGQKGDAGRKTTGPPKSARERFEVYCEGAAQIEEALPQPHFPAQGGAPVAPSTPKTPTPDSFLNLR